MHHTESHSHFHRLPSKLSTITTDDASYFNTPLLSTNVGVADYKTSAVLIGKPWQ